MTHDMYQFSASQSPSIFEMDIASGRIVIID